MGGGGVKFPSGLYLIYLNFIIIYFTISNYHSQIFLMLKFSLMSMLDILEHAVIFYESITLSFF